MFHNAPKSYGPKFFIGIQFRRFAWKHVDSIFRGPRHNLKNLLQEKQNKNKNSIKFWSKMPPGPMGQEFWPEYNFGIFAWKLVDSIFRSPWNKWKNLLWRKKKNC